MHLVLFFTQGVSLQTWASGGMLPREIAIYERFAREGVDVSFVTYGNSGDMGIGDSLAQIHIVYNRFNLPVNWYAASLKLAPPQGDIFKSNQILGADIAQRAAHRQGAKFIARCGYLFSEFQEKQHGVNSAEAEKAASLERNVFEGADRIVVTTEEMAATVNERYSLAAKTISVIPNYVEIDRFVPVTRDENERLRIGFVGRLEPQKNLFALIDAVSGLDIELNIVGNGSQKSALQAHAKQKGANILFLGPMTNAALPVFLAGCDLFVLPSLYEGHPKALLEAMACGLPVVGTRVSGIQELIRDGDTGLLCETDAGSLRETIKVLLDNAELRSRLGRNAREFVVSSFSLDRIFKMEMALLQDLAANE